MKGGKPGKSTRRQHTVWCKYMRAWASKEQVWCSMGEASFRAGLMKVGQQKGFYRVRDMTDQDIALVHAAFVAPMNSEIQKRAAERWLTDFNMLGRIRRYLESQGIDAASALEPLYIEAEENSTETLSATRYRCWSACWPLKHSAWMTRTTTLSSFIS